MPKQIKGQSNPKVDFFFNKADTWQPEFKKLRTIILDCGLTEELKWGVPCYTFQQNNIVLIHVFKEYCAFLFFKGAPMDSYNIFLVMLAVYIAVLVAIGWYFNKNQKSVTDFWLAGRRIGAPALGFSAAASWLTA